jgi:hypothetical protein
MPPETSTRHRPYAAGASASPGREAERPRYRLRLERGRPLAFAPGEEPVVLVVS